MKVKVHNSIKLRVVTQKDLFIIRNWRNSKGTREFNTQYFLLNMVNQRNWFNTIKKKIDRIMFIITKNQIPIGVCGLINLDKKNQNADVAIIIGNQETRKKGIGSESLRLLIEYGFKKLNLHRIEAEIFEFNTKSIKLFENLGFQREAIFKEYLWRDGKWWNVYSYAILKNEYIKTSKS